MYVFFPLYFRYLGDTDSDANFLIIRFTTDIETGSTIKLLLAHMFSLGCAPKWRGKHLFKGKEGERLGVRLTSAQ